MEQVYTFGINDYLVQKNMQELEEKEMPDQIEKMQLLKVRTIHNGKCDACPNHANILYYLEIGDTSLVKLCLKCLRRLRRAVR